MRTLWLTLSAAAFAVGVLFMDVAVAGEYSSVPFNLAQIQDPLFRDAMAQYSPRYNSLSRNEQIAAFVNMYKVLNNGQNPPLSPQESAAAQVVRQPVYRGTTTRTYDPWNDPYYDPERERRGILSDAWF